MDFANNYAKADQGFKLWPHELAPNDINSTMQTSKMKLEMLEFDKLTGPFWGALLTKFADTEKLNTLIQTLDKFEDFFKRNMNGAAFLSGRDEPMMIDVHVYPIVERFVMMENSPWAHGFETMQFKTKCPTICAYVDMFRKHPKLTDGIIT